jgi:hypothetical protein
VRQQPDQQAVGQRPDLPLATAVEHPPRGEHLGQVHRPVRVEQQRQEPGQAYPAADLPVLLAVQGSGWLHEPEPAGLRIAVGEVCRRGRRAHEVDDPAVQPTRELVELL